MIILNLTPFPLTDTMIHNGVVNPPEDYQQALLDLLNVDLKNRGSNESVLHTAYIAKLVYELCVCSPHYVTFQDCRKALVDVSYPFLEELKLALNNVGIKPLLVTQLDV